VIVRWGLDAYDEVLREAGIAHPLLVTSPRWTSLGLRAEKTFDGVGHHVPASSVEAAKEAAEGCDGLVAVGGGSAIDTGKAVSAALDLPLVSIPTTYSGAEWTTGYGILDEEARVKRGGGGAHLAGIVYDEELTLSLPRAESGGTAMNALAHCAEALYVQGRNPDADREALAGATLIADALPAVLAEPDNRAARHDLLDGAMHAGAALAGAGLGLGHALAQALGARFGIAHGAANALCLPAALRFNEPVAHAEIARFAEAIGAEDAPARVEELARLGGYERLRDLSVPEDELDAAAEAAVIRPGARMNPRPATAEQAAELLHSIW
jgi:maleylacetate reductase